MRGKGRNTFMDSSFINFVVWSHIKDVNNPKEHSFQILSPELVLPYSALQLPSTLFLFSSSVTSS